MPKTAVVICPGRGSYAQSELGYLTKHHSGEGEMLAAFDARRRGLGQTPLMDLDAAEKFSSSLHTRGDNASALIYASTLCDARAIDPAYEVVGVMGNSMGWYSALAVAGALSPQAGFDVVNTMGTLMQEQLIGRQTLVSFVDDDWRAVSGLREDLLALVADIAARPDHDLAVSIHLGGVLVVAGNAAGLEAFEASVLADHGRQAMRLRNHAAFHTALQHPVAGSGQARLGLDLFGTPKLPMIDGEGRLWYPNACTAGALRNYTLGPQVTQTYDFTKAVEVAARTFAPDVFILTGPGNSLGSAVAQSLIGINWQGLSSKADFLALQNEAPVVLSMGRAQDRKRAVQATA